MQLEELRQKLRFFNLKEVAKATGINYQKVYWVASGRSKNPPYNTVRVLVDFIKRTSE